MADTLPDNASAGLPAAPERRRTHSFSRFTTAVAVLAFAIAGYSLWLLDDTRDRLNELNRQIGELTTGRAALQSEVRALAEREQLARRSLEERLAALNDTPKQLQEFGIALEELRGRAEGPERAWSRAEAYFLMEYAQRRLALDRDVDTAIIALEAADSLLASLRDPSVGGVRQQLARELQALRTVRRPDIAGILARLTDAEERAASAPVLGSRSSARRCRG